jgi:hypothetical protein
VVTAAAFVSACDRPEAGPANGEFALGGLGSRLIFRNNDKGTHTYTDETHHDVTVVPSGGATLTDEYALGRCVQLTKTS